jgi:hypothetical protein
MAARRRVAVVGKSGAAHAGSRQIVEPFRPPAACVKAFLLPGTARFTPSIKRFNPFIVRPNTADSLDASRILPKTRALDV